MAVLKTENEQVEVNNNEQLIDAAEKLGVSFGCREGVCGTCKVQVLEGMENLEEKNTNEEFMNLEKDERLMCQCRIKTGNVKIKF